MDSVRMLAAAAGIELRSGVVEDWGAVERSLNGLTLPTDYKQIVDGFPAGTFKELVKVIRPGTAGGSNGYLSSFYVAQLDDMRGWRAEGHDTYPYPLFPEENGLLPWGSTPMGGLLFWLTEADDPDDWPVVWANRGYEQWHVHQETMSEFLLAVIGDPPTAMAEHAAGDLATNPAFRAFTAGPRIQRSQEETEELIRQAGADAPELLDEAEALLAAVVTEVSSVPGTDWAEVERLSGARFPADFRRFYDALGPGVYCDITIVGPQGPDGWNVWELLSAGREQLGTRQVPFVRFFPDAGGILPWGVTPDGWILGWQTWAAGPQSWTVAAVDRDCDRVDFPELSFSTFLLQYAGLQPGKDASLPGHQPWSVSPSFRTAYEDNGEQDEGRKGHGLLTAKLPRPATDAGPSH